MRWRRPLDQVEGVPVNSVKLGVRGRCKGTRRYIYVLGLDSGEKGLERERERGGGGKTNREKIHVRPFMGGGFATVSLLP